MNDDPILTVSMPTWTTPGSLLRRAVESVLHQDVPLRLVVVNDGGPPVNVEPHPQLVVFDLLANRGRYFADAVVLAACDTEWFAVHDADDWSEPDRYKRLIGLAADGATVAPHWPHGSSGSAVAKPVTADPGTFAHLAHWCSGVYSVERMNLAGGIHPGFRVGFDTLHTLMMTLTGPVAVDDVPSYHYCRRPGSLTKSRSSGKRSSQRMHATRALSILYRDARACDDPGSVIRDDISSAMAAAVQSETDRLRELL